MGTEIKETNEGRIIIGEKPFPDDLEGRDSEYIIRRINFYRKVFPYSNKKSSSERVQQIKE